MRIEVAQGYQGEKKFTVDWEHQDRYEHLHRKGKCLDSNVRLTICRVWVGHPTREQFNGQTPFTLGSVTCYFKDKYDRKKGNMLALAKALDTFPRGFRTEVYEALAKVTKEQQEKSRGAGALAQVLDGGLVGGKAKKSK
jgi:hypothetical protein